jgi:SEC-C motif-containing protein
MLQAQTRSSIDDPSLPDPEESDTMSTCPCGSGQSLADCCAPRIDGTRPAETAEALMRARYTAFTQVAVDYLYETIHPTKRGDFDKAKIRKWAASSEWQGLEIRHTADGGAEDTTGVVEFVATYYEKGRRQGHHEIAQFRKEDNRWYFLDGEAPKPEQFRRPGPKVGRNDPCPCGSGRKFKKCCGA